MAHEQTVIIYHGKCPDGFGGAYAAWKKFGDTAEYIPLQYGKPMPEHMDGRDLFFVDFCPKADDLAALAKVAKSLTILDHHEGVRDTAEQYEGVFDPSRSGATIAWAYFHPDAPAPKLFSYLEDYDLYRFSLPETKAVDAFITLEPFEFPRWEEIANQLEEPATAKTIIERGNIYLEQLDKIVMRIADSADLVEFEGHQIYLSGTILQAFTNDVGHILAEKQPPFALMVRPVAEGLRVSIRGVEGFDVSKIAQKYGGNGHPGAAAFKLAWGDPIPWKPVPKEDTKE